MSPVDISHTTGQYNKAGRTQGLQHVSEGGVVGSKAGGAGAGRGQEQVPAQDGLHQEVQAGRLLRLLQEGRLAALQGTTVAEACRLDSPWSLHHDIFPYQRGIQQQAFNLHAGLTLPDS